MRLEINVEPRKSPVQMRSKRTVETILAATAQVLVARGYAGATTGAVAERAGISIGTLYQYFPNRDALLEALLRAHAADLLRAVDEAMVDAAASDLEAFVAALIRAGLRAHQVDPALHRVLVEEAPRRGAPDTGRHQDIARVLQDRIEAELLHRTHLGQGEARLAAFVIETCIEALTHRAVLEAPDWLTSGALEQEARRLLLGYVAGVSATAQAGRLL